jgi:hypothetical protein
MEIMLDSRSSHVKLCLDAVEGHVDVRKSTGQIILAPGNPVLRMESATNLSVLFFSESSLEKVQRILVTFVVTHSSELVNQSREHGLPVGRMVV